MSPNEEKLTFWDHLDVLRGVIFRIALVVLVFGIIAFVFKDQLFAIVLAPQRPDFITYRLLGAVCARFGIEYETATQVQLINTGLAQQFIIHMKTAICAGIIVASPYVLYQIFSFISPGLYEKERHYAIGVATSGYVMFIIGAALSYFVIFPMTFQFLGSYQVADNVSNLISLESYMSTLLMLSLCMGIVCEMPVLAWLFARGGILSASFLRKYRRHAIVIILVLAAIITPTSDVFTLMLVSVPIWLLFEVSIVITAVTEKRCQNNAVADMECCH